MVHLLKVVSHVLYPDTITIIEVLNKYIYASQSASGLHFNRFKKWKNVVKKVKMLLVSNFQAIRLKTSTYFSPLNEINLF